jgi:hypothetical protein
MPEAETVKAVQLLDLMLEFFADDGRWARGCYDDGNGGRCLVGALLQLGRQHRLPTAPAIGLLQEAMPRPGLPLVHFNDTRCGSAGELRSVILKARRLAHDDAERERAAAAVRTWLLAQIEKKRAAPATAIGQTAPEKAANDLHADRQIALVCDRHRRRRQAIEGGDASLYALVEVGDLLAVECRAAGFVAASDRVATPASASAGKSPHDVLEQCLPARPQAAADKACNANNCSA